MSSELLQAIYRRDDAARDAILAGGHEPDVLEAAALGDVARLSAFVSRDPDAWRARASDGFTPLHYAAFFGGAASVELLLRAGADPDADQDNPLRVRPLHSAAAVGDADAVRALLDAGAEPDPRQAGGHTPLHTAAHNDDPALARILLDHGADPGTANDAGETPRDMAGERVAPLLGA